MSLFQSSVLQKHLSAQDQDSIASAYEKYTAYFLNPQIQENIRGSKEEQFQEGFLRELFVNILGYTINPNPNFNLTTELKNIKDAKKTDGAVLKDGKALAVIELKGADTKDLDKVTDQAFNYKNNQPECVYVVTSNFEKLRFYIHNAVQHEEFHLFTLTFDQFKLLWLFLQKDNILRGVPEKLKEESLLEEERVTKRLYKDYSAFKSDLWQDMCRNNSKADELELYKKSQKLLDRFLFIFFAEDKGLLPPNSISLIFEQWKKLKELDEYKPLYGRFQKYFGYMNDGFKGKNYEIHAYNGGLFKADPLLDDLTISDEVLEKHVRKLTEYDFETEVDTNILGHIFEHSLNDIENVRAQLAGEDLDKSKTKRKKDGIFYTPKYITKYIIDNTVGKLCEEKKAEIGIDEEEFAKDRKGRKTTTLIKLDAQLKHYREWLLQLTICDPACGSGAFLNQALEFLMAEHRYVDELESQLLGYSMVFPDVENHILERNIFGVDINEESVEIARLSLWLRTAQKGRKLSSLSSNIKVGNSLIDDPEIAGELAFNWHKQFPIVFQNGGFDVVVGNPPYVNLERIKKVSDQLAQLDFQTYSRRGDLYCLFVERGLELLKHKGEFSFIMPNKWLQAGYGKGLRELMLKKNLRTLIDFGDYQIFEGATTYPCIFFIENAPADDGFSVSVLNSVAEHDFTFHVAQTAEWFKASLFNGNTWVISSRKENALLERLKGDFQSLSQMLGGEANYGIKFGLTEAFLINEVKREELITEDPSSEDILGPLLRGRDLKRYGKPNPSNLDYIILASYGSYLFLAEKYPAIYRHLLEYEDRLRKRGQCSGSKATPEKPYDGQHHWLELDNNPSASYLELYRSPKIMYQTFQVKPCFTYDKSGLYCNNSMWIIPSEHSGLTGILNSKMGWWLISKYCTQIQNGYQLIWKYFGEIPVPSKESTMVLNEVVDTMIETNYTLDKTIESFVELLQVKFPITKSSKKLKNWPELDFTEFLAELKKVKVQQSLEEESEWLKFFTTKKSEANALQANINRIEKQIDQMVYELYGLSEDEILIVEQAS